MIISHDHAPLPPLRLPLDAPRDARALLPPLQESPLAHATEAETMSPFAGCTTEAEIRAHLDTLNRWWWGVWGRA